MRAVHPIEVESYRVLRERLDLSHLPPLSRAVCERVVHASADLEYAETLVLDERALERGRRALVGGAQLVADSGMVAAGIARREAAVPLRDPRVRPAPTRSAAGFRLAAHEVGPGAVWVVGSAPTALEELLRHPALDPALVVGLPVGFVGAAESKAALAAGDLPHLTNRGEKGGSAVAAAAVNALLYFDPEEDG